MQSQLRDVDKLLKLDPGNTVLQEIAAKGEKLKKVGENVTNVGKKFLPVTAGVVGFGMAAVKTAADFE